MPSGGDFSHFLLFLPAVYQELLGWAEHVRFAVLHEYIPLRPSGKPCSRVRGLLNPLAWDCMHGLGELRKRKGKQTGY